MAVAAGTQLGFKELTVILSLCTHGKTTVVVGGGAQDVRTGLGEDVAKP